MLFYTRFLFCSLVSAFLIVAHLVSLKSEECGEPCFFGPSACFPHCLIDCPAFRVYYVSERVETRVALHNQMRALSLNLSPICFSSFFLLQVNIVYQTVRNARDFESV